MRSAFCRLITAAAVVVAHASAALALPAVLNHQGRLLDAAGEPMSGTHTVTFTLYEAATGGAPVWTATYSVPVTDGIYSVMLGDTSSGGPVLDTTVMSVSQWLGMSVDGGAEMTPRLRLSSVPFSFLSMDTSLFAGFGLEHFIKVGDTATDATNLGGFPAGAYARTMDVAANFASIGHTHSYDEIENVPLEPPPHTHDASDIDTGVLADARIPSTVVRSSQITDVVRAANIIHVKADLSETANGSALLAAVNAASPTQTKPVVIRLESGIYDVGTSMVFMKSYMTIEGAGPSQTVIRSNGASSAVYGNSLATNAGIRRLWVQATDVYAAVWLNGSDALVEECRVTATTVASPDAYYGIVASGDSCSVLRSVVEVSGTTGQAIGVEGGPSTFLRDTDVTVSGTGSLARAVVAGSIIGGTLTVNGTSNVTGVYLLQGGGMRDVQVQVSGSTDAIGVSSVATATTLRHVDIDSSGTGVSCVVAQQMRIHRSTIRGTQYSVRAFNAETFIGIAHTQLDGPPSFSPATGICVGAFNASFAELGTNCTLTP